jgi:hypothetical protein
MKLIIGLDEAKVVPGKKAYAFLLKKPRHSKRLL